MFRHVESGLWAIALGGPLLATQVSSRALILLIAVIWIGVTVTVIPLHFYKAWRKLTSVPNRREYALWVGLETFFAVGVVTGVAYMVSR
jgi:hypothetical protein